MRSVYISSQAELMRAVKLLVQSSGSLQQTMTCQDSHPLICLLLFRKPLNNSLSLLSSLPDFLCRSLTIKTTDVKCCEHGSTIAIHP